jgi:hypothetical protein
VGRRDSLGWGPLILFSFFDIPGVSSKVVLVLLVYKGFCGKKRRKKITVKKKKKKHYLYS